MPVRARQVHESGAAHEEGRAETRGSRRTGRQSIFSSRLPDAQEGRPRGGWRTSVRRSFRIRLMSLGRNTGEGSRPWGISLNCRFGVKNEWVFEFGNPNEKKTKKPKEFVGAVVFYIDATTLELRTNLSCLGVPPATCTCGVFLLRYISCNRGVVLAGRGENGGFLHGFLVLSLHQSCIHQTETGCPFQDSYSTPAGCWPSGFRQV